MRAALRVRRPQRRNGARARLRKGMARERIAAPHGKGDRWPAVSVAVMRRLLTSPLPLSACPTPARRACQHAHALPAEVCAASGAGTTAGKSNYS